MASIIAVADWLTGGLVERSIAEKTRIDLSELADNLHANAQESLDELERELAESGVTLDLTASAPGLASIALGAEGLAIVVLIPASGGAGTIRPIP